MGVKYDFSGYATKNDLRCSDGRTIRKNAFKDCDGKQVPLVWQHQHNEVRNVLGHALLENREDGVYCYGSFNNSEEGQDAKLRVQNGDITHMSIYANQLTQDHGNVLHGVIREVSLVLAGANPGALIDYPILAHSGELIEDEDAEGRRLISEIGYTIDNTTKTRALFEINKGIPFDKGISVNSSIPEENRRVHMNNMIYIADGPSDIPAFSVVRKGGGATFAIYPKGDARAMAQVEEMRDAGRVDMYAEADYSEGSTAYMWIMGKIKKIADRIRHDEQHKIRSSVSGIPQHLNV